MSHVLAGCGQGISQSCSQYAKSGWSGGGVLLLLVIILVIVACVAVVRRRGR